MSGYIGNIPTPQATQSRQSFTATASQTTFATVGYTAGFIDVYLNGVHLLDGTDYTATNGSDIVLTTGAALNDVVEFVAYETFSVLDQSFTGTTTVDVLSVTGNATFGDNDKAIFGAGSDLQIYHDGSNSYVEEVGTGSLLLRGVNLKLQNSTNGENYLVANQNGSVFLYYDNVEKLATTSTGVDVTGTIAADGIYLGGTGAANKLDDYEEGTWTPTMAGLTLSIANGKYTKIGELITCTFQINSTGVTNSNAANLGGLPFTNSDMSLDGRNGGYITYNQSNINFTLLFLSGNPIVTFRVTPTGSNGSITQVSGNVFWGTIIYRTAA